MDSHNTSDAPVSGDQGSPKSPDILSGIHNLVPAIPTISNDPLPDGSAMDHDEHMANEEGHDSSSRQHTLRENMITMNRGVNLASKNGDLDRQIALLRNCECIKESEVRDLCNMARDILLEESNIQNI